jgi:G3E family GTPase
LRAALAALPDAVLRAKGFVRFDAAPERVQLVQVVGRRWSITPALLDAHVTPMLVIVGTAALQPDDVGDLARLLEGGQ